MDGMVYNKTLNERMYQRKLSNGLNCYIIPKEDFREKTALISINCGAVDGKFICNDKNFLMPEGTAHFLEHRMFGNDYFERFARLGASVNAFTSLNLTAYYFSTVENFDECLTLLLEMVQNPRFAIDDVNKEKDVISQEIRMYEDDPRWVMYLNLMDSMFHMYPVKSNIAGTLESIDSLTPEVLYDCHSVFYTADNMNLVCAGDICKDRTFDLLERLTFDSDVFESSKIIRDYGFEPEHVVNNYVKARMPLAGTMFSLGFKDIFFPEGVDMARKIAETKVVLDYVFGESSRLYEHLYYASLIDRPFEPDFVCGSFFGAAVISCASASHTPDVLDVLAKIVFDEIKKISSGGFDEVRFNHIVKKHIGRMAMSFNNITGIVMAQSDMQNSNISLFELADKFASLNPDDFLTRLNVMFTRDNSVLSAVEPIA